MYYQPWFLGDFKIDTVNNIRSVQRLTTHAKLMGVSVGVVLQAILEEASGRSPAPAVEPVSALGTDTHASAHGLLDVEVGPVSISPVLPVPEALAVGLRGSAVVRPKNWTGA